MKIAILGYSGSGKSTLARALAKTYALPALHLDQVHFQANWQEKPEALALAEIQHVLAGDWVIDGNYRNFAYQERVETADQIYILSFSRWRCLGRVLNRTWRYHGRVRPDMAEGCPERFDWAFIWWILYAGRTKAHQAQFHALSQRYPEKVIVLRNQKQLDQVYRNLKEATT